MTIRSLAVILVALVQPLSSAWSNDTKAKAQELTQVMGTAQQLESLIPSTVQLVIQADPNLSPYQKSLTKFYKSVFSSKELLNDMVDLYANTFSVSEMDDLIQFYKTPTGKKSLKTLPQLFQQGSQIGQSHVQRRLPELQKMIEDEQKKTKKL